MKKNTKPLFTIVKACKHLTWGLSIPLNDCTVKHYINGVNVLTTTRNYYYDSTQNKVRFTHMGTDDSSAKFYVDVYPEVYPGLYAHIGICTDANLTDKLEQAATQALNFNLPEREVMRDKWRDSIVLMN